MSRGDESVVRSLVTKGFVPTAVGGKSQSAKLEVVVVATGFPTRLERGSSGSLS